MTFAINSMLFYFIFYPYPRACLLILETGGKGGREGEKHYVREKYPLVASPMPPIGYLNP